MISVQVNVTAPVGSFNGFEFFLYYDPAFLNATSADTTNTIFPNSNLFRTDFGKNGTLHLAGICLGCNNNSPDGAIVNINFKVLGPGVSPLTLAAGLTPTGFQQSFTELTRDTGSGVVPVAPNTADGYFMNEVGKRGPVASFRASPAAGRQDQRVTFYANASYDLDAAVGVNNGGIAKYKWDFGGVSSQASTVTSPTFSLILGAVYGNFSVRLTVVDLDDNLIGIRTQIFFVSKTPLHDLIAQNITPNPRQANPGDKVAIKVIVYNNGTFPENFNLLVSYSSPTTTIGTETGQSIIAGDIAPFSFTLDTTGLSPGFYTLTANVTVIPSLNNTNAIDQIPGNNLATNQLNILGTSSSSSPLLLVIGGTVAGIVALSVVGVLLRRRRRASASD